jgi:BirA family transcriptional regulator, biotin operon repressor / biotin---[acetyl-CoA-carboxylase] ligase
MSAWQIENFDQIESTNALALARIQQAIPQGRQAILALHGQVIVARQQTAGHGQHGRVWASPAGGLYMSAVVADLPVALRPLTALLTGVAVAEALESAGIDAVRLRWPNDLVITAPLGLAASRTPPSQNTPANDENKVAGILCEGVAIEQHWLCVVGVGVNVNTEPSALPPELCARATTLLAYDGKRRDIARLLQSILARLDNWTQATPDQIIHAVQSRDALRGKQVTVQIGDTTIFGRATGINADGALTLATQTGVQSIPIGSIVAIDGVPIR